MTCRLPYSKRVVNDGGRNSVVPVTPSTLLASISETQRQQPVYVYIVKTIKTTGDYQLDQQGSAPNFDGGRITFCTCKHKDRATFCLSNDPDDPWRNVWVAGLTSKSENPSRSLAYLICVERSFSNQMEIWRYLPDDCRQAKSASRSEVGDLFEPKATAASDPYNPANYYSPIVGRHVHSTNYAPNYWHKDVKQWVGPRGTYTKPHRLLLGQASQSYRWTHVKMILKLDAMGVSAHHRLYATLNEFIADLQEFAP